MTLLLAERWRDVDIALDQEVVRWVVVLIRAGEVSIPDFVQE